MIKIKQALLFATLLVLLVGVVSASDVSNDTSVVAYDEVTRDSCTTDVSSDTVHSDISTTVAELDQDMVTVTKNVQKVVMKESKDNIIQEDDKLGASLTKNVDDYQQLVDYLMINNQYDYVNLTLTQDLTACDSITLDASIRTLIIDGNGKKINGNGYQFLKTQSGTTVTLNNIQLFNFTEIKGGAIYNNNATLNIIQSTLSNNTASDGGAIYNNRGTINIEGSTLSNNIASHPLSSIASNGGAIYNYDGTIIMEDTSLNNNSATDGGSIYNFGVLNITGGLFSYNSATDGGAIYNDGVLNITGGLFSYNNATRGGAIYNYGVLNITGGLFSYNNATSGGAIFNYGVLNITGGLFSYNSATDGGAIYTDGVLNITGGLFSYNNANKGAVIYNNKLSVTVNGSNFMENTVYVDGGAIYNNEGNLTVSGSDFSNNVATTWSGAAIYNVNSNTTLSVIDNCNFNNNTANKGAAITNYMGNLTVNGSTFTDNTASDGGAIHNNNGAINIEGSTLSNNIASNGGAIYNYNATLTVANSTLNNNNATFGGAIKNYNTNLTVTNSTLSNNTAKGTGEYDGRGGAIHIDRTSSEVKTIVNINNSTLSNNTATNDGGAIYNYWSILNIINVTLNNNNAKWGGAIRSGGAAANVVVTNSTLNNNSATSGGAIANGGIFTISNSTLNNNNANKYGGAIYHNDLLFIKILSNNFTENHATSAAAIFSDNSYTKYGIDIINNTFTQNTADNIETLVHQGGEIIQEDNTYNSTDILLNNMNLTVKDEKQSFALGEEVVLNFTIKPTNINNYLDYEKGIKDITLYINGVKNVTTTYENYTLSGLEPGDYEVYFTSCNSQSNTLTFRVRWDSEILTDEESYDYYEDVRNIVQVIITDESGEKGTVDISVKDGEDYISMLAYHNVKGGYMIQTATLAEALTYLYEDLDLSYTIKVTYYSDYASHSSTEFTLNIIKQRNTTITYDIINNTEGNVQINITVMDTIYKSSIEDATIKITGDINNETLSGIIMDTTLTPGDYTINVNYEENADYKASNITIDFTVEIDKDARINELEEENAELTDELNELLAPKETTITLNPLTDAKYNSNVTISGTLISEGTNGLFDQTVTLTVCGSEVNVTTVGGLFEYSTIFKSVGKQTVTARFAGTDKYNASNTTQTFTVNKKESEITINDIASVTCNDNVTISGIITDIDGNPLGHVNVYVYLNGEEQHVTTYRTGIFKATFTTATVDQQEVLVVYNGNSKYLASNASAMFTATSVKLVMFTVKPVTYRDTYTIQGKLTDTEGNVITGAEVKLTINDETITLTTDKNGRYTYKAQALKLGNFTVTASYIDEATATELKATKVLSVSKRAVTLVVDEIPEAAVGSEFTITGKLTDEVGTAYKNSNIYVKINGEEHQIKTDNRGVFTCTYIPTTVGTQNVTVTYKGNSNYLGDKVTTTFEAKD